MLNLKKYIAILVFAFLLFESALLFGEFDLTIWQTIGNAGFSFGDLTGILSSIAGPMLFALAGLAITTYHDELASAYGEEVKRSFKGVVVSVIGIGYSCIMLFTKGLNLSIAVICSISLILIYFLMRLLLKQLLPARLFQIYCIAVVVVYCFIAATIIIACLQIFWGRAMPSSIKMPEEYTAFFEPQGYTGHRSFPSANSASVAMLYALTMLAPLQRRLISKILVYSIPIIMIIVGGVGDVIYGAAFASDALFGAVIVIALFYLFKPIAIRRIAKSLE